MNDRRMRGLDEVTFVHVLSHTLDDDKEETLKRRDKMKEMFKSEWEFYANGNKSADQLASSRNDQIVIPHSRFQSHSDSITFVKRNAIKMASVNDLSLDHFNRTLLSSWKSRKSMLAKRAVNEAVDFDRSIRLLAKVHLSNPQLADFVHRLWTFQLPLRSKLLKMAISARKKDPMAFNRIRDDICPLCNDKSETKKHFLMDCPEAVASKLSIKREIITMLRKRHKFNGYDLSSWFDSSCSSPSNPFHAFDPELGSMGFVPSSLPDYLQRNGLSNIDHIISSYQLSVINLLFTRWLNRRLD